MRNARIKKWGLYLPSLLVLMAVTYQFWLPGWTITRAAEISGAYRLGRATDMKLFRAEGNGNYSVHDLTVYNKEPYSHIPFFSFKNVFFCVDKNNKGCKAISNAECCNGDIYIIAFADGSTNLMCLPIRINGKVTLCNVRLHVNSPKNDPLEELVLSLDGTVSMADCGNNQRKVSDIDLKIRNSSGVVLASVENRPKAASDENSGCDAYPFVIKDFDLKKLMTLKESVAIMRYYPVIKKVIEKYNSGSN